MRNQNAQGTSRRDPTPSSTVKTNLSTRMGSSEWADEVFSTPPVRNTKGPSKHTQHHDVPSLNGKTYDPGQGYEFNSVIMLNLLLQWKIINRWKPQPFQTDIEQFGSCIYPDFLVEIADTRELVVLEMKTARFLTREKHRILERTRSHFEDAGLRYIVWTDEYPLCYPLRHHLVRMRVAESDLKHIDDLVAWVQSTSHSTFEALYNAGFGINDLYAATWNGRVFFPITQMLSEVSQIQLRPFEDIKAMFLGRGATEDMWWRSLETW